MQTQIRNLGVFLTICYVILFAQLNRYTVFDAEKLQNKDGNNRQEIRDFSAPRGTISTADGVLLAKSVEVDDQYKLQREYPGGDLYSHIVGTFNPLSTGTFGVEKIYNNQLAGDLGFGLEQLGNLFEDDNQVGNLTLTLRDDVQQVARTALEGRKGSVVALDPRTGEILAAFSNPTYDPKPLASHNFGDALAAADALDKNPDKPRLAGFYQENLPPGSTFKVVVATAGIEYGDVTNEAPVYEEVTEYTPRGAGTSISNSNGRPCGGTLFTILARSCNTSFAKMGAENLTGEELATTASDYGFDHEVPIDLTRPAQSTMYCPDGTPADAAGLDDPAIRAQSSIGGRCVRATPLQMAMVAAAVANGGDIMKPHVLKEIRDNDGNKVKGYDEKVWTKAMQPTVAAVVKEAMKGVVEGGTADDVDNLLNGEWEIGAKTGTAPLAGTGSSHAWMIVFAGPKGEEAQIAIAAVIEAAPGQGEQFGSRVAGPVAAQVLKQVLEPTATEAETTDD